MLAACGGGAGTVGLPTGTALFSTAPSTVSLSVGASANYTIGGGTPLYTVSSSNLSVATAVLSNGKTLTINGVSSGTVQISILDAAGAKVTISVTVGSTGSIALFTTAPSALTLAVGAASTFTIGGGVPTYAINTSNAAIAGIGINGSTFVISGVSAGTAQVKVLDSAGSAVTITVTVGSGGGSTISLFTTAPGTLSLSVGGTNNFTIGGGSGSYFASSSNSIAATASVAGTTLTINGVAAGSAQINVVDSTGNTVTIAVTVGSGGSGTATPLFTTSASADTIQIGKTGTYTIGGGTAPYFASSNNTSVATTSVAGATLSVNGVTVGSSQVTVSDSVGATVIITITVPPSVSNVALYTTSASAITMAVGAADTFTVGGGSAPYSASSSNTAVAAVNIAGSVLTVNGVASGTSQVLVFDSTGASVSIGVTVSVTSSPVMSVQPDGATGNVGDVLQFVFTGGIAPYTATVADASIATLSAITVNSTGGTFNATLVNAGSTNVSIVDSTGQTHSFTLTAAQISTSLRLSPDTLIISEDNINSIVFEIYGGTGPYTAFTSNQIVFSTSTSGATLTVGLGSSGNRCVTPLDTSGVYVKYGTFPVTITAVDSKGASATAIITIQDNGQGGSGSDAPPPCH